MFRNGFVFRIIGAVIVLGLIAVGGFMAFKAGEANGIAQAPAVATAISKAAENGQPANVPPMMYGHGYGFGYGHPMMYGRHHFGFFSGAFCFGILFLFLLLGALRMMFFGRMHMMHHHGGGHWRGPWGRHWEDGVPPMFNEWHKRAHGEQPADEKTDEEKK